MQDQDDLVQDVCLLALTRPAMFWGVTMEVFAVNFVVTGVAFVLSKSFVCMAVGVAFHLLARVVMWNDVNQFRVLRAWTLTRGRMINRAYWGGSSASPIQVSRKAGGSS